MSCRHQGADALVGQKSAGKAECDRPIRFRQRLQGIGVKTQTLPAQAIIRDKDTWVSGSAGFELQSIRAGG